MAGGMGGKLNSKIPKISSNSSNEVLKDSWGSFSPQKTPNKPFSLSGILGLNQTIDLNRNTENLTKKFEQIPTFVNHLEVESKQLLDSRQKDLEKKIEELRNEIKQLIKATDNLEKQVEVVALQEIIEPSEYQINFFIRIKNFIANFRKNISEAGLWLDSFTSKKKKRNAFWNNVKNKKTGGEQYLMSNEHSVARSSG